MKSSTNFLYIKARTVFISFLILHKDGVKFLHNADLSVLCFNKMRNTKASELLFIDLTRADMLRANIFKEKESMIKDNEVIETLTELEAFLTLVENGDLGLTNVQGIALATNNNDGRPFVAVLDEKHQLLLGRWVSQEVFENGKDMVRYGVTKKH